MFVMLASTSTWAQTFTADGETLTITTAGDMTSAEVAANQSQWMRSYLTASNGVCWDGVTAYRPTLTAEQIALLRQAGYSEAEYSVDDLAKIAFVGTRQFVLGNGDFIVSNDKHYDVLKTIPFPKVDVVNIMEFLRYLKSIDQ